MSAPLIDEEEVCAIHERPAYLWGGPTCDYCDRDNNGINDASEPVGSDALPDAPVLFKPPNKGFRVISSVSKSIGFPQFGEVTERVHLRVMKALQRKLG